VHGCMSSIQILLVRKYATRRFVVLIVTSTVGKFFLEFDGNVNNFLFVLTPYTRVPRSDLLLNLDQFTKV